MRKKAFLAVCAIIAVIFCCCGCSGKQEDSYRMIQVLEVSGSVSVERNDIGAVEAYAGMRLQSGDAISVPEESWLLIQMDEDKYALVEPGSSLSLEASGSSADSKTVIHLEAGAISSLLESQLSDGSVYEVTTPNSTMAVRGTVFRVEVTFGEGGVSITNVSVYNGTVECRLIYPDGTVDDEEKAVLIFSGTGAQIRGDDKISEYVSTGIKISFRELRLRTLKFLKEAYQAGMELSIPEEALDELIAALEKSTAETGPEATEAETEPTEPKATEPATEPTEPKATEPTVPETTAPTTEPTVPETTAPVTEPTVPEETASTEYTVTFQYDGKTFATQTVAANGTAAAPKLQPTASGAWNFDFTTVITADTTIEWVDSAA